MRGMFSIEEVIMESDLISHYHPSSFLGDMVNQSSLFTIFHSYEKGVEENSNQTSHICLWCLVCLLDCEDPDVLEVL